MSEWSAPGLNLSGPTRDDFDVPVTFTPAASLHDWSCMLFHAANCVSIAFACPNAQPATLIICRGLTPQLQKAAGTSKVHGMNSSLHMYVSDSAVFLIDAPCHFFNNVSWRLDSVMSNVFYRTVSS